MDFVSNTTAEGAIRLALEGDLTIYHADEIRQRLIDIIQGESRLDLDLSQVMDIDSAGLQVLLLAKREALATGKEMRIVAHSPAVQELLDFLNVAAYFGDPLVIPAGENA